MASPISFQGLATNLPTDELVSAVIAQESEPMVAMQTQQTTNKTKATALGTLSTDLTSLSTAINTLATTGFSGDTVTSSDSTNQYVTASANGATPGTYELSVQALATNARLVLPTALQPSAAIGTGTYTITDMAGNTVSVNINSTNNTLSGLAAAINAATDQNGNPSDVSAAVIQTGSDGSSQLVLSAVNTGLGTNGAATFQFTMASGSALAGSSSEQDSYSSTGASLTLPAVASTTTAVGAGTYVVTDDAGNTANITLGAGDTLATLMNDINSGTASTTGGPLNVTASIQTGANGAQLVLTPKSGSGAYGITVASGSALANTITDATIPAQDAFSGTGTSLLLPEAVASPTTALGAGTYVVKDNAGNTADITLGAGDTLTDLMNDINSATASTTGGALNLTASIQTGTNGSQLLLTPKGGLGSYGITVAAGSGLEVPSYTGSTFTSTAATDAAFTLNGVQLTRTSNSVNDAVQGVTFTLNSAQADASAPTTLTIAQNTSATTSAMQAVVSAYNQFYKDYQTNNTFTQNSDGSYTAGVFNMDMTVRNLVTEVSNALMGSPGGLPSGDSYTNPADVGLLTTETGSLSLNTAQFQAALTANPTAVQNLFANAGISTSPLLTYVSSGANTTNSPIAYSVAANSDGSLTATLTVGSGQPITLQSDDGYFAGASGTALEGLTFQASAGATGTLSVSTGISSSLQTLITSLTSSAPGDIGGLVSNLNETNSNLNILISQQQTYLAASKASLLQVYANLESTVGSLQAAGQSISTM